MRNHWMVLACAMTLTCLGCTEESSDELAIEGLTDREEFTGETEQALSTATFSGVVRNERGSAVVGATVKINGVVSTTDSTGRYYRSVVGSTNGYQISITMPGYVPTHEVALTGKLGSIHVLRLPEIRQINPTQSNTVTSSKGVQVTIPANSLVDAAGVVVTSPVNILIGSYDAQNMPGDYTATNAAGQTVALETVGAAYFGAVLANTGAELRLRSGYSATATIPVTNAGAAMPACVAANTCRHAMWRFDQVTGRWIEKPANRTFTSTSTTFVMTGGTSAIIDNGGLGMWNADIEKSAPACTVVQFVGIPMDCYRPPSTPTNADEPGLKVTMDLPNSTNSAVISKPERVVSSLPFIATYNITANVLQNVGVTFPAGAPAYCAANLEIYSDTTPAPGYPTYTPNGGTTRINSGAPWGGVGAPRAQGTSNVITLADVSADPPKDPCKSHVLITTSDQPTAAVKTAMTWAMLNTAQSSASNVYGRPGADATTEPYQGDTWTNNKLPILCISKTPLLPSPSTSVIGAPYQTPGGAWRATWSGGMIAVTSPVKGTSLTSRAKADALCASQFGAGYRMAEHHDGDPTLWSGWDFWGKVYGANLGPFSGKRYWVAINDTAANPW